MPPSWRAAIPQHCMTLREPGISALPAKPLAHNAALATTLDKGVHALPTAQDEGQYLSPKAELQLTRCPSVTSSSQHARPANWQMPPA